jgi:hypothetical protein
LFIGSHYQRGQRYLDKPSLLELAARDLNTTALYITPGTLPPGGSLPELTNSGADMSTRHRQRQFRQERAVAGARRWLLGAGGLVQRHSHRLPTDGATTTI